MSSVAFWILAIAIWLAGVFGIAVFANWIFDGPVESMVLSGTLGAFWGLLSYGIGSYLYDNFVD
jgi:hypothetical protein